MGSDEALKLLREIGIYRLAGTDGCLCMHCSTNGIDIDVSCRKSSGRLRFDPEFYGTTVRVHSGSLDSRMADLQRIADEVVGQLKENGGAFAIRLCDGLDDDKNRCIYCHAERVNPEGYYCDKHEVEKPCG